MSIRASRKSEISRTKTSLKLTYTTEGGRNIPIMHKAFKNLEIKHANTLVSVACSYRNVSASDLRVLDIGYGLGYSYQRFYELGVGTLHCVEVNQSIYNDLVNHDFSGGAGGEIAIPLTYENYNSSWEDYADNYEIGERNPGYDIIYYSPCDDIGNMYLFRQLRRVSKQGTILSIQGLSLFDNQSEAYQSFDRVTEEPGGVDPDSDAYDSSFTVSMYNTLNNLGYFKVRYQYLNCSGGSGDSIASPIAVEEGGLCNNGIWLREQPRLSSRD